VSAKALAHIGPQATFANKLVHSHILENTAKQSAVALACLLAAGAVSAFGFAPANLWPLTFLALAFAIDRIACAERLGQAALRGWVFGIGHFVLGLNWIATAFTYQSNMPAWLGWVAVVLLSLYLACFPALAGALAWGAARQTKLGFAFMLAAAWMLFEWLRATLFTGFAWNPLAVIWIELPWAAQAARWIGTYGLSGLAVLLSALLWVGLRQRWAPTAGLALALAVICLWLGRFVPARPEPVSAVPVIPVRIVQPNISQDEKNDPDQAARNAQLYAKLSGKPLAEPRLLLWPEGSTERFLQLEADARHDLASLLGPGDLLLLSGESVDINEQDDSKDVYHNSVFELDSTGALRWRYDKAHLVPFGEYLPARSILSRIGLSRLLPGEGDFSPGPGPRTFPLRGFGAPGAPATVGVQVCYEIIFSGRVIDEAHRPTFLFNPSDDAWFGAWGPPQHLAQAQLRAVEEGVPIIRATPNGISAVIGPTGRLLATIARHHAGVIDTTVPQALPPTLFSRLGLWTSAVFGVFLGVVGFVVSHRSSGGSL
jgi:apolipoprotein N-acyltransferase